VQVISMLLVEAQIIMLGTTAQVTVRGNISESSNGLKSLSRFELIHDLDAASSNAQSH
jgi:hypothetical protein